MDIKKIDSGVLLRLGVGLVIIALSFFLKRNWLGSLLLGLGWIIGDLMSEIDQLFYVAMCNPQELTCQRIRSEVSHRNFKNAWGLLNETRFERNRLPVHNVLTGVVVALMGLWFVSSSGGVLAIGVVAGLSVKLLVEFWQAKDWHKWYWLFAREFAESEHKAVKYVWTGLVVLQLVGLLR